jgi:hypothetical protein
MLPSSTLFRPPILTKRHTLKARRRLRRAFFESSPIARKRDRSETNKIETCRIDKDTASEDVTILRESENDLSRFRMHSRYHNGPPGGTHDRVRAVPGTYCGTRGRASAISRLLVGPRTPQVGGCDLRGQQDLMSCSGTTRPPCQAHHLPAAGGSGLEVNLTCCIYPLHELSTGRFIQLVGTLGSLSYVERPWDFLLLLFT